jgi:hypothetical protein
MKIHDLPSLGIDLNIFSRCQLFQNPGLEHQTEYSSDKEIEADQ